MRLQTVTGKFPTEKPPDPENGNPGAVGTATGAKVRSVLRQTASTCYRKIVAHASPASPVFAAA
jgi:hypothetical protein